MHVTEPRALIVDAQSVGLDWIESLAGLVSGPDVLLFRCTEEQVQSLKDNPLLSKRISNFSNASLTTNTLTRVLVLHALLPCNTIVITSDPTFASGEPIDIAVGIIGLAKPGYARFTDRDYLGYLPDLLIRTPEELIEALAHGRGSYIAEEIARHWHHNVKALYVCHRLEDGLPVIIGGRYFSTEDPRSWAHPLSRRILNFKNKTDDLPIIEQAFRVLVRGVMDRDGDVESIAAIPPRPGTRDRFQPIVEKLSNEFGLENLSPSLSVVGDLPSQKTVSSVSERHANVAGSFAATRDMSRRRIMLLDDVITSGATIKQCAQAMYDRGAASVVGILLAVNQFRNEWRCKSWNPLLCPSCGRKMHIRFSTKDGRSWARHDPFFGCSGYSTGKCDRIVPYEEGRRELLERNSILLTPSDDEWL